MAESVPLRTLYPALEPYQKGFFKVSDIHELYYEQSGNPDGKQTVVVLHGGPGGGLSPWYRQFFDPQAYRIVMFDQRGSGDSKPHAELRENTTWDLVADIERLRVFLKIEKWVVFGGSWGSTLALAYAEKHTERVKALILRGIFTLRRKELLFFYQEGTSLLFPDYWEKYLEPIPKAERGDLISAYHRRLTGPNEEERMRCAKAWTTWEMATSRLHVDKAMLDEGEDPKFALAFARIECHFFVNAGWFDYDGKPIFMKISHSFADNLRPEPTGQLIEEASKLKGIPGVIVQGRYDMVCPAMTAWDLHKVWPESDLKIISDAGHSMSEVGIKSELVIAADRFRDIQ